MTLEALVALTKARLAAHARRVVPGNELVRAAVLVPIVDRARPAGRRSRRALGARRRQTPGLFLRLRRRHDLGRDGPDPQALPRPRRPETVSAEPGRSARASASAGLCGGCEHASQITSA